MGVLMARKVRGALLIGIVAATVVPGSKLTLRGIGMNPRRTGLLRAEAQRIPHRRRQPAPDAQPAREDLQRVARHADLHVGLRPAVVVDPVLRLDDLGEPVLVGDAGLVVDQGLGAQQVGDAGRHVADLRARCLGMPFGEQGAIEAAETFLDFEAGADFAGERFVMAEAEQPIERNLVRGGDVKQRLGAGQARGCS